MAALAELARDYRDAARLLRLGLEDARVRLGELEGPERMRLEAEMRLIRQMLQEVRDLRQLCEGYYRRPRDGRYTTACLRAARADSLK